MGVSKYYVFGVQYSDAMSGCNYLSGELQKVN